MKYPFFDDTSPNVEELKKFQPPSWILSPQKEERQGCLNTINANAFRSSPKFVEMISEETKPKQKTFTVLSCLFSFLLNISLHQNTNNVPTVIDCTFLRLSMNGILLS